MSREKNMNTDDNEFVGADKGVQDDNWAIRNRKKTDMPGNIGGDTSGTGEGLEDTKIEKQRDQETDLF